MHAFATDPATPNPASAIPGSPPLEEYRRRWADRRQQAAAAHVRDLRLATSKLVGALVLLVLLWLVWVDHDLSGWWAAAGAIAEAALFVAHAKVLQRRQVFDRAARFYERAVGRLEHRWMGAGTAGARFADPEHVFSSDLDLFGSGSLFELLCLARTPMGEDQLARWLLNPAPPPEIAARQQRVRELTPQLDLREQVLSQGDELKQQLDPARLQAWGEARPRLATLPGLAACLASAGFTIAAGIYALATGRPAIFLWMIIAQGLVSFLARARVQEALGNFGANGQGLRLFAHVLAHTPHNPAPLRRLATIADWAEASDSLMGKSLDFLVLYSLLVAFRADAWRARWGGQIRPWLDAVGEFEALLSLAGYAYDHPNDPFAEMDAASGEAAYQGDDLGHPFLPESSCVRNSVRLDAQTRVWLVSGSNMSGKSTLLRTVGINAVLAQMGAPVRAARLRLSPLNLGARLRTSDSLQAGRSGFYAEILRLRRVFDLTRESPALLFLFDELLEGTNSHDRVQGAAGLLRALLQRRAIGLVTTHDLALAAMAEQLGPAVRNVHFEDQISGDDVRFDHQLRPGVVTKSNAVALMRIIGLEV